MKHFYKKKIFNEFTLSFANSFFYNTRNIPTKQKAPLPKILMLNVRPYQHKIWKVTKQISDDSETNLRS